MRELTPQGRGAQTRLPTTLVVVGGTRLAREAIAQRLSEVRGLRVVGTFAPDGAYAHVAELAADVALVDALMPRALEVVRNVVRVAPEVRVVALGIPEEEDDVIACAEAGVSSFLDSEAGVKEVVAAVEGTMRDELVLSPRIAAALVRRVATLAAAVDPASSDERFTAREREVAALLELGLSNKEIATRLSIALPTVKNHVHSILEKLGATSRGDAAARLRRLGTAGLAGAEVVRRI